MFVKDPGEPLEISSKYSVVLLVAGFVLVNVGSALGIWLDKRRAVNGEWRIREETLLVWALVGGWPGGIWAMRKFRHKTSKPFFIARYVFVIVLNIGAIATVAYALNA